MPPHLEMHTVTRSVSLSLLSAAVLAASLLLAGCSSIEKFVAGDKVDYRAAGTRTGGLEVPPDLTQLTRDSRTQGGSVSAAALQAGTGAANEPPAVSSVAPRSVGEVRVERLGNQRWLVTPVPPEQLWPQLRAFWIERGFTLSIDQPNAGVMETEWAENRTKLPNDIIRNTIGRVFDSAFSTGERDKYRSRVERSAAGGSEIYITHRGVIEVYSTTQKDSTVWQPRQADAQLEAEQLTRLMVRLGTKEEAAKTAVAAATPTAAPRARVLAGQPAATLEMDDDFDRAWRRVGLALDRSGFTVEDRDRAQGLFFVRYVDPANAAKSEPGFFGKLFSFGKSDEPSSPLRYRVLVKGAGERSTVSVLNGQGGPDNGAAGQRIVTLLTDELK